MRLVNWCAALLLIVSFSSIAFAQPDPVTLINPTPDDTVTAHLRLTYDWTDATGGTAPYTYRLYFSTDSTFPEGASTVVRDTTHSSYFFKFSTLPLPAPATIYWRVVTIDAAGDSSISVTGEFYSSDLSCCQGRTGDLNLDGVRNLTDITWMVLTLYGDFDFKRFICGAEWNTTGDASCVLGLTDLTRLINMLFVTFSPTGQCDVFNNDWCP